MTGYSDERQLPPRPLRIALFHNLPAGGAKRHTCEQVRELVRRGYEIEEFTFSTSNRDFMPLSDFARAVHVYPLVWKPLHPFPVPGVGPYVHLVQNMTNLVRLDRLSKRVAADMDARGFDLVFAKDCMFTVAPQIMRYTRTPCIFYAHSLLQGRDPEQLTRRQWNIATVAPIWAQTLLVRGLDSKNTWHAKRVLTNSIYTQQRLKQSHGVDAKVVYPGVDISLFRPTGEARDDYVLSVGAVNEEKGHRLVLEAVGDVPADMRPRLLVAGNQTQGPEADYLRQRAVALAVQLEIGSFNTTADMARIYSRARVLVVAALYERLGLAALEAMACGTPVIGVKQGGLPETIEDGVTGLLVSRTPVALAEALHKLLIHPELAEAMGRAGRARIESYWTWARAVDDLEKQFNSVLEENPGTKIGRHVTY